MNEFFLVLFSIVLAFDVYREGPYIFIYYTIWTFTLETFFFALMVANKTRAAKILFPFIYAPSIVVCIGFWVMIAPMSWSIATSTNIVLVIVTHGVNMFAMLMQPFKILHRDAWKPMLYTTIYNLFLAIYVGRGGRSISGKLPYWYAEYDRPIGWIFAFLAITASTAVHVLSSTKRKAKTKVLIV